MGNDLSERCEEVWLKSNDDGAFLLEKSPVAAMRRVVCEPNAGSDCWTGRVLCMDMRHG